MPLAHRCTRRQRSVAVKHRWSLTVDSAEGAALIRYADTCPEVTVTVTQA